MKYFRTFLTLVINAIALLEPCACDCIIVRRLAGASPADIGDFPYLVAVLHPEVRCTGSLVSSQWILSAAHCAVYDRKIIKPSDMVLVAGVVDFNDTKSKTRQIRKAKSIYPHPNFEELKIAGSDIALIKAERPFELNNEYVSAIKVSGTPFTINSDTACTASGWGDTKDSSTNSKLHQLKVIAVQSKSVCHGLSTHERKNMICLRNNGGSGLCDGDSGGPLVCEDEVVGVAHQVYIEKVNYTGPSDMDCGSSTLVHTYMFVCPYLDWMRNFVYETPKKPKKCFSLNMKMRNKAEEYDYQIDYERK
ncbi:unnamed protein product [Nezara viridula]|uniref:Peptidase S1 domain-containing protein n=2 Tax=Nezara viridula TaxID=85310 RepID=A0A9P0E6T6_NEZVI|nr:unnamed protein product [Nezara viridula]